MTTSYHHGDLRQAIISITLEMIKDREEDKIGIREIARRLNVSRSAPYRHFKNIDDIYEVVIEEGYRFLIERLKKVQDSHKTDPRETFIELGVAYVAFAVDNPSHYRLMFDRRFQKGKAPQGSESLPKEAFDILANTICDFIPLDHGKQSEKFTIVAWSFVHGLADLVIGGQIPLGKRPRTSIRDLCLKFVAMNHPGS
ncbi:MAG: TetR/AcrR family transcriptional regulator [Pseudobacteriovorax sp.]|nr:TetR/AcrR family transcriptional regulator [Pseudobacteriovorax sp.]